MKPENYIVESLVTFHTTNDYSKFMGQLHWRGFFEIVNASPKPPIFAYVRGNPSGAELHEFFEALSAPGVNYNHTKVDMV